MKVLRSAYRLIHQTVIEWMRDNAARVGAAMAFYAIFSFAPLVLISIKIAGLIFGDAAAGNEVYKTTRQILGPNGANAVQQIIRDAAEARGIDEITWFGIIALAIAASGMFRQLKDALNTIWNVEPKPGGIVTYLKGRLIALVFVPLVGILLMTLLASSVGISMLENVFGRTGFGLWRLLDIGASFLIVTAVFAVLFRVVPDVDIEWKEVWLGAAFTAVLFVAGKYLIGLYLGRSAVTSSFGAAGSLVVLLIWIFFSSQVLFFGAEFTQVYANTYGSLREERRQKTEDDRREAESTKARDEAAHPTKAGAEVEEEPHQT